MDNLVGSVANRTWITLCHPADPRNVGGVLRVAANFGFRGVRIVTEKEFDERDLLCFSSEASIHVDLEWFPDLDSCLHDQHFVLGTTRRQRDPDAPPMMSLPQVETVLPDSGCISLLFGAERTGLTVSEVERCHHLLWIPTTEVFPSMNLAHAVAVLGYAMSQIGAEPAVYDAPPLNVPARVTQAKQEAFFRQLERNLNTAQYPPGRHPLGYLRRLRRLLTRANPSQEELGLLGGVFSELARLTRIKLEKKEPRYHGANEQGTND